MQQHDPVIPLLADLVATNSENPSLRPGAPGEKAVAELIADTMRSAGMEVELSEVEAGRPNVVGVLEGRSGGPSLMFCGHTDTVAAGGMENPFTPRVANGRLYGRGAQDMKAGLAAMIDAVRMIARGRTIRAGRIIVAAVVDEEYLSIGADALVKRWRADGAVVPEPTELEIKIAHRGFAWIEISVHGKAAHGSRPHEGQDAILQMGRVLTRLHALDRSLQTGECHPLLSTGSLHASMIEGGREMSTYPDLAVLKLEQRTLPGQSGESCLNEITKILGDLRAEDPTFRAEARLLFDRPPYELKSSHALPLVAQSVLREHKLSADCKGAAYWTDAAILSESGTPAILFGPSGHGLHSDVEYAEIDGVIRCRDVLRDLAYRWCGG